MKAAEVYRLAVLLDRHEGANPKTSTALAELIFALAKVYQMGGAEVPLSELIARCRDPFSWMFVSRTED